MVSDFVVEKNGIFNPVKLAPNNFFPNVNDENLYFY